MQFAFTEEQNLIRESVASVCDDMGERANLYEAMEAGNGFNKIAWTTICQELAMSGAAIPEALGGAGLGYVELASVMEKMGRVLLPTPFLTSIVMSATALALSGNEQAQNEMLPGILAGEKIASFAYLNVGGQSSGSSGDVKVSADGKVSGTLGFVQYGDIADYLIVHAQSDSGAQCFLIVDTATSGVSVTRQTSMDLTRPVARVELKNAAIMYGDVLTNDPIIMERVFDIARICLGAEQLGAAEAVLELTREYAMERHQFGRAIGSFQAVKHRLADMMVLIEAAKSAVWYAACAADQTPEDLPMAAALSMVVSSRALTRNASHMIQLHGGMGFTWECLAHLYFKRAAMSEKLLSDSSDHRETLAAIALGEVT